MPSKQCQTRVRCSVSGTPGNLALQHHRQSTVANACEYVINHEPVQHVYPSTQPLRKDLSVSSVWTFVVLNSLEAQRPSRFVFSVSPATPQSPASGDASHVHIFVHALSRWFGRYAARGRACSVCWKARRMADWITGHPRWPLPCRGWRGGGRSLWSVVFARKISLPAGR